MAFVAYVHGLTLAWNLGYEVPMNVAVVPAVAVLYVGIGSLVERAEQNWTIGVRTPWTLSDETVWKATHRHAAVAFKVAGIVAFAGLAFPEQAILFVLAPVLLAASYTVGYSFLSYRRRNPEG